MKKITDKLTDTQLRVITLILSRKIYSILEVASGQIDNKKILFDLTDQVVGEILKDIEDNIDINKVFEEIREKDTKIKKTKKHGK